METVHAPGLADYAELLDLADEIATRLLDPIAGEYESSGTFPREMFREVGRAGLLGLPFAESVGGAGVPYLPYLAVLERLASAWATIGVGVSVHVLSCLPIAEHGTAQQRESLPAMLGGELLGAFCLSEPHAGSDPSAMVMSARRDGGDYVLSGTKAWITHGGEADFYTVFARTGQGPRDISCFHVPASVDGLVADPGERKMGLTGSRTSTIHFDDVRIPAVNLIGAEGAGLTIALEALDCGRLGIAAVATGLAQAALDLSVDYSRTRESFGRPILDHQGIAFILADMLAATESARAMFHVAAARKDAGLPFRTAASVAKLIATDNAMRVTTDAVQVLGGAGYVRDFPAERYMREAKVMQIFEGTNQIQRLVIARELASTATGGASRVHH